MWPHPLHVGGEHDFAGPRRGFLEAFPLVFGRHGGVQRQHPALGRLGPKRRQRQEHFAHLVAAECKHRGDKQVLSKYVRVRTRVFESIMNEWRKK